MSWNEFYLFAIATIALWLASGVLVYSSKKSRLADLFMLLGIGIFTSFIVLFWLHIDRPPMRTMGETRLWYSLFICLVGYISYRRSGYRWMVSFSAVVASIFVIINLLKPEIHSKALMPALQSVWFIPHVTSYILSYSMFGAATIAAVIMLSRRRSDRSILSFIDNTIYIGYGFLMLGLLMGAIWAKDAWGHYWSWDPKETWAFITSAAYLGYIHLRVRHNPKFDTVALYLVIVAFVLLMITWLGVSYLPSAQASVHVY